MGGASLTTHPATFSCVPPFVAYLFMVTVQLTKFIIEGQSGFTKQRHVALFAICVALLQCAWTEPGFMVLAAVCTAMFIGLPTFNPQKFGWMLGADVTREVANNADDISKNKQAKPMASLCSNAIQSAKLQMSCALAQHA